MTHGSVCSGIGGGDQKVNKMEKKTRKTFIAPKLELENLYFNEGKTIRELSLIYDKSHTTIEKWFRIYQIKARIPKNKNQNGSKNHSWKGDRVGYNALHNRVKSARGKANHCEVCGESSSEKAYDWANLTGNYWSIDDYQMMCRSCHFKHDKLYRNLRNGSNRPGQNMRKAIDNNKSSM